MSPGITALQGWLAGTVIAGAVALFVAIQQRRRQTYYAKLVELCETNNRELVAYNSLRLLSIR